MLIKWLLVSLLILGVQNTSVSNYINYIDNFNIFYDPNTCLALKGALEYVGRDSFSGIGFRGANCSCEDLRCSCCSGINITTFNIDHYACTNITFYPKDLAMNLKLTVNEKELLNTVSNSDKAQIPFCVPFYPPFISFCVRVFDIYLSGRNLHACIDLEARVISWPILILHFDCVKIGADGISWLKPDDNSNIPQLTVIKPEVNGPEIYDPVDFEPSSVGFPNNHTSNMTLEEQDNIGQLKI
ncbi:hypothetical protein ALC53_07076 [Atta colombica]|uniref:DUF4773 domain-containing protein n=1 Tax=Atta colombica TaxID=520822 RepID=A0A195BEJ4_9HYME|nr:hypothetical protein ALC53_07076 [Atta colombica]